MKILNDRTSAPTANGVTCLPAKWGAGGWLGRSRDFIIAGLAIAAVVAVALNQHWLLIADLVPLLFVLPCAAMMFMCMKGMNHGQQTDTAQASSKDEAPANKMRS